jgi:hypothetical protein
MAQDDLVVSKIIRLIKSEVFSHILDIQTERYTSVKNHVQLRENLAFSHDSLIGNKHSAVELRGKKTDELLTSGLVVILEECSREIV